MSARLSRAVLAGHAGVPVNPAPIKIVHFGLGAFHRAHQAWFTSAVDAENAWGIAAFTGRSPAAAEELAPQDGLFTLIERSSAGDVATVVHSLVEVGDGARIDRIATLLSAPSTAIVTLTITESGYGVTSDGSPDFSNPLIAEDAAILRGLSAASPRSALARLVLGLDARRRADGGPIAIVPCDNMPSNGRIVATAVTALAACRSERLAAWVKDNVSFVSTSVDRITPKTTDEDCRLAEQLTGWEDRSPVVTEPFSDWVLEGSFPKGRPAWELAGAKFVDDIEPFERRKLWLLNGAHSLLACAGRIRGFNTVAEAIADPLLRREVTALWDEAVRHLPQNLDLNAYRLALLSRFENERIEHRLEQIALDSTLKIAVRIAPIARAERRAGRDGVASARAIAAWLVLVRSDQLLGDSHAESIARASSLPEDEVDRALVSLIDPVLAADNSFLELVVRFAASASAPVLAVSPSPSQGELS